MDDCHIACLETDGPGFYERLGWEDWRRPLGGRSPEGVILTPDQSGVMILQLPRTRDINLEQLLTIEAYPTRIW